MTLHTTDIKNMMTTDPTEKVQNVLFKVQNVLFIKTTKYWLYH